MHIELISNFPQFGEDLFTLYKTLRIIQLLKIKYSQPAPVYHRKRLIGNIFYSYFIHCFTDQSHN